MKPVCCYGLSKSSSEENVTDAEVSGHRFQPRRQRHVLEDRPEASDHEKEDKREAEHTKDKLAEMLSTDGGAEAICWCGDSSLSVYCGKNILLVFFGNPAGIDTHDICSNSYVD